ncbi:MAG: Aminotransferase class III superfamily [Puniceicoccaceae bacterium 5H]|nr:MAG: Aminotransferase class III superfamily [Puniceicoccaceae bacterium 5H]
MSAKNDAMLTRALRSIPWGTQTNAKRVDRDHIPSRPPFIERARGCRMWDLDGREYIDYRAALGPIVLGYCHEEVDTAVRRQMERGTLFSMASPLEVEAAEAILNTLGWADQIRFMKTGADVCACCLRIARSHTQRDHVLVSGYHGYHDWFALGWPNHGVPHLLEQLVHEIAYDDIPAMERVFAEYGPELAAAVVVPLEWHLEPSPAYLQRLRELCNHYGVALVFDEILTGFRLGTTGAAGYFGVTPDLAAFAKGMANGYPLSAYAGKRAWMETLNQMILTTTYAGETLSLAASLKVMEIFRREPVHAHLFQLGAELRSGFEAIFLEHGFPATTIGVDPGAVIDFAPAGDAAEKLHRQLFTRLYERGIFANEQWFITYAHTRADIEQTLEAMAICVRDLV